MKILLAPSETKREDGHGSPLDITSLFMSGPLLDVRHSLMEKYSHMKDSYDRETILRLFGLKKDDMIERYTNIDISNSPTMKAILRYTGVAYDHLSYDTLPEHAKSYIDENVIIFSNLFGPILASDHIPDYRVSQSGGVKLLGSDRLYSSICNRQLDSVFEGQDILDIRANFYEKFYIPSSGRTVLKFLKSGKVVSHWAKAYRGIVLRALALSGCDDIESFLSLPIEGLSIEEIRERKGVREVIYSIGETS
jgi:cytoplasmic iron level regulating protein YaaA (DUF328/UPF0246 family)